MSFLILALAAQIEVHMGDTIWSRGRAPLRHYSYDVAVDGKSAGRITSTRPLTVDIDAGRHVITVKLHTLLGGKFPVTRETTIAPDDHRSFAINVYQRNNPNNDAGLFGLLGVGVMAAVNSDASHDPPKPSGTYIEEDAS